MLQWQISILQNNIISRKDMSIKKNLSLVDLILHNFLSRYKI